MDFSKYDPIKQQKQIIPKAIQPHKPWMSSTPVILLIEYLRKYPDQGVILYERGGQVGLEFNPGISCVHMKNGRAQIAMNATGLLQDAYGDIRAMIADGIEIPLLVHYAVSGELPGKPLDSAGPSWRP